MECYGNKERILRNSPKRQEEILWKVTLRICLLKERGNTCWKFKALCYHSEAATRGALWKKVILEISENSQENTCAGASFLIKLLVWVFTVNFEHISHLILLFLLLILNM